MPTSKSSTSSSIIQQLAKVGDHSTLLVELLATVHRDGGQYTTLVGLACSVEDAIEKVFELYRVNAALNYRIKQLVNKEGNG